MKTQNKPATHTPHPWRFDSTGYIVGADLTPVAVVKNPWDSAGKGNGCLIAAAPELLAVLKKASWSRCDQWITEALEAIARAEGQE